MRKLPQSISYLFCFSFLILPLVASFSQQSIHDHKDMIQAEKLYDIFFKFILEVKPYGFPLDRKEFLKKVNHEMDYFERFNDLTKTDGYINIHSAIEGRSFVVSFNSKTSEITRFEYFINEDNNTLIKPKLDEEAALKKMLDFPLLKGDNGLLKNKMIVSYEKNHWNLLIIRTTETVSYLEDLISVDYSEKHGFLSYYNSFFSEECKAKPRVTKEEAEKIAVALLPAANKNGWIKQPELAKEHSEMKIINPRLLYEKNMKKKSPLSELRKTKLAWIIIYGEEAKDIDKYTAIIFYIDAVDGQIIFTDYFSFLPHLD